MSLHILVRLFFVIFFLHCELRHFSPFIYNQLVPLVSATPLTVLDRLLLNFAHSVYITFEKAQKAVTLESSLLLLTFAIPGTYLICSLSGLLISAHDLCFSPSTSVLMQ